jgi:hypothetical protein
MAVAPAACFATEADGDLRTSILPTVVTSNVTLGQQPRIFHLMRIRFGD